MRILVTGSRTWRDYALLSAAIVTNVFEHADDKPAPIGNVTIVHGACPRGADALADKFAKHSHCTVERHPADWDTYGRGAGFRRNAEMVNLGADLCLAFIKDDSRGASHTADLAEKAGIKTVRYRQ